MKFNLDGQTNLIIAVNDTATEEHSSKTYEWAEAGLPWTTLLDSFVDFLSAYYGYDISGDVAIRRNPARMSSGWRGEYFGKASDEEIRIHQKLELDFDEYDGTNYGGTNSED